MKANKIGVNRDATGANRSTIAMGAQNLDGFRQKLKKKQAATAEIIPFPGQAQTAAIDEIKPADILTAGLNDTPASGTTETFAAGTQTLNEPVNVIPSAGGQVLDEFAASPAPPANLFDTGVAPQTAEAEVAPFTPETSAVPEGIQPIGQTSNPDVGKVIELATQMGRLADDLLIEALALNAQNKTNEADKSMPFAA